jgi:hypothetical protein
MDQNRFDPPKKTHHYSSSFYQCHAALGRQPAPFMEKYRILNLFFVSW